MSKADLFALKVLSRSESFHLETPQAVASSSQKQFGKNCSSY
jgi:hypothetical protein